MDLRFYHRLNHESNLAIFMKIVYFNILINDNSCKFLIVVNLKGYLNFIYIYNIIHKLQKNCHKLKYPLILNIFQLFYLH